MPSSRTSSTVMMRSVGGHCISNALSMVVLPAPVPPVTSIVALRRTNPRNNGSQAIGNMPWCAKDSNRGAVASGRRMLMAAPCGTNGAITACTRTPSTVEASAIGQASSRRRPSWEHSRTAKFRMDCAESNGTRNLRNRMPSPPSTHTEPSQVTAISVTPGSRATSLRGPSSMIRPLSATPFLYAIGQSFQGFAHSRVRLAQSQSFQ